MTVHFMSGMVLDMVICELKEYVIIYDTKYPEARCH